MKDIFLICVEFREGSDCFMKGFFRGRVFFETEVVESGVEIEFVGGIIFGKVGFD